MFIPLLFMGGLIGRLFHEFAVTVSLAILVSGVISLTLTPMLCSRFLRAEAAYAQAGRLQPRLRARLQLAARPLRNGLEMGAAPSRLHARWSPCCTLVATVWLYTVVPKGFFPQQDTGIIMGTTDAAQDISFAAMAELQQKVARHRAGRPGGGHDGFVHRRGQRAVPRSTTAACSSP